MSIRVEQTPGGHIRPGHYTRPVELQASKVLADL